MAIDSSGNVYVTGASSGDYATIKYNSNGDSIWVKRYNGPVNGGDYANSIAIDGSGNVYVTGFSDTGFGNYDYATIKYNSSGVQQWVQRYDGPGNSFDDANSIAVDNSGNVYVTGSSGGNGTGNDYATIKYNSNGDSIWVHRYNGPANGNDYAYPMAVDSSGNVYVTGGSSGIGTNLDYATIKYSQPTANLNLRALIEGFYDNVTNIMVKDTVRVYLRNTNSPYSIVDSAKTVLDSIGNGALNFSNNIYGNYIVVKHRSSIETWSNQVLILTSNLGYDFTTAVNTAYGNNLVLKGNWYCIYSGDVNQDGTVGASDFSLVDNDVYNSVLGYVATDVNGDNIVEGSDYSIVDNNTFNFVKLIRP